MEEISIIGDPFISSSSSSSCTKEEDEKVDNLLEKVDNLLEKAWFFGNSLNQKIPNEKNLHNRRHSSLARAPSLPAYNVIKKISSSDHQEKQTNNNKVMITRQKSLSSYTQHKTEQVVNYAEKVNRGSSSSSEIKKKKKKDEVIRMRKLSAATKNEKPIGGGLLRSDSVPIPAAGLIIKEEEEEEEIPDEESYARLSNLIRQALPDTSDSSVATPAPSRRHASKGMTQSSSFPITLLSSQNSESTTINSNPSQQKINHLQPLNKTGLRRTMTSLEFDEVEGFKDMTFTFKNKSPTTPPPASSRKVLNPNDYLSLDRQDMKPPVVRKLGRTQSLSPPIPSRVIKQPSAEDMKEQIKFWARSVACNINPQE